MDIIGIINLIDRSLDLVGRLIERSENEKDLKEYVEVRREVRKAKVEAARSLGGVEAGRSVENEGTSDEGPRDPSNDVTNSPHTTPAPNDGITESEDFR